MMEKTVLMEWALVLIFHHRKYKFHLELIAAYGVIELGQQWIS